MTSTSVPAQSKQPQTDRKRQQEALAAADAYYGHLEQSPEFSGVAQVALKAERNPLLRLAFADGYLRGQDTVPWQQFADLQQAQREAFERITALRLALRDVVDQADATEPCSVSAARIASEALEVDGQVR